MKALAITALLLLAGCATPRGVEMDYRPHPDDFGPWSTSKASPAVAHAPSETQLAASSAAPASSGANPDDGFVDFVFHAYSNYLTKIDGARCEHRPTCSRYAYEAVKAHGYIIGALMTVDRLVRGNRSSVLRQLEVYKIENGRRYYYDPLDNNDFFF